MIIETNQSEVKTSLKGVAKKFSIAESPEAFEILSSSLYEQPKLGVVRELICNAIDAHIEKNVLEPPRVTLPTRDEPQFVVEDFGRGIAENEIDEVYTTYFASSKNMSNDQNGAFGLGAKVPLAYTNEFLVETACSDLKRRSYLVYKDEEGYPRCVLTSIDEVDRTGTKVVVSIQRSDLNDFADYLCYVYPFLQVSPKITNPNVLMDAVNRKLCYYNSYETETEDLRVLNEIKKFLNTHSIITNTLHKPIERAASFVCRFYGQFIVKMGSVAYGVDDKVFDAYEDEEVRTALALTPSYDNNRYRVLHVDIGDFPVSPSRETLSFKGNTTKRLYDLLLKNAEDYYSQFISTPTTKEAVQWLVDNCATDAIINIEKTLDSNNFKNMPFIRKVVERFTSLRSELRSLSTSIVFLSRRCSKSFSVFGIVTTLQKNEDKFLSKIESMARGVFFTVSESEYLEIIESGTNNQALKSHKTRKILNYLLTKNAVFARIFNLDDGCFVCTKSSYDVLKSILDVPDAFDLFSIDVPRAPRVIKAPTVRDDKVFTGLDGTHYSLAELSKHPNVIYDVVSYNVNAYETCIIDFNKIKDPKAKKEDCLIGFVHDSWKHGMASESIRESFTHWCNSLALSEPFPTKVPFTVGVSYSDFKRYKLWTNPRFKNALRYYAELVADKIPVWYSEIKALKQIPRFIDEYRKFSKCVIDKIEKTHASTVLGSEFYLQAKKLFDLVHTTDGHLNDFNVLERKITIYGLNKTGVKMANMPNVSFKNNEDFFKLYPMLKFLSIYTTTVSEEEVNAVAHYIVKCDSL
jgi:hypothetical protein